MLLKLTKEDWTHLGGQMGTEYTTIIWDQYFTNLEKAKEYAEEDHSHSGKDRDRVKIEWEKKDGGAKWFSGDLSSHAYYISKIKVR